MVPKVESAGEVGIYADLLSEMGAASDLVILVESCRGMTVLPALASASRRVQGLAFGAVDLSTELGSRPTWESLLFHRSALAAAGGLAGRALFDTPYLDIKDLAGLSGECRRVRDLGYTGKLCIHPSQVDVVNQAFQPSSDEIRRARAIVDAARSQGTGAIQVDGRMVDAPVVTAAERVVALADQLGLDPEAPTDKDETG